MKAPSIFICMVLLAASIPATTRSEADGWIAIFENELPRMGHRNFIVVADSAYPLQSNPGIRTVWTGADHVDVLERVLEGIEAAPHVRPLVYLDRELEAVTEEAAPGIGALRESLDETIDQAATKSLPHMEIIQKLDASAELFQVLVLKTNLTLPYSSVFIELDCGYWSAEKETALRKALGE